MMIQAYMSPGMITQFSKRKKRIIRQCNIKGKGNLMSWNVIEKIYLNYKKKEIY